MSFFSESEGGEGVENGSGSGGEEEEGGEVDDLVRSDVGSWSVVLGGVISGWDGGLVERR